MIQESKDFIKKVEQLNKMTNDKLPEEILEQINTEADKYGFIVPYDGSNKFYNDDKVKGYQAGATAWAPWKVKHDELLAQTNLSLGIQRKCTDDAQATAKRMILQRNELKAILQEFVSKHEAGLLPDRFVYEKAINILKDGTTTNNAG